MGDGHPVAVYVQQGVSQDNEPAHRGNQGDPTNSLHKRQSREIVHTLERNIHSPVLDACITCNCKSCAAAVQTLLNADHDGAPAH